MQPLLSKSLYILLLAWVWLPACQQQAAKEEGNTSVPPQPLFTLLSPGQTGIDFNNFLTEALNTNVLMYEYFYNGGGVAVGDLNGDGLEDIYFTANMTANRLYLNKGRMQFEDITDQAGVSGREGPWKTGVSMADVNGDGLLDLYVCYSGKLRPEKLIGQLYINQGPDAKGIPHFAEKAQEYGLGTPAHTTQAVFFDYDQDSDLDLFQLNHSPDPLPALDDVSIAEQLKKEQPMIGVRLYEQETGPGGVPRFRDVTRKAGLSSSALTYGLGAGVADINGDGWTDIYVSNDYTVPDYLYINEKNGTFVNQIRHSLGHVSHSSMGNDVVDVNNDALPDIFTLDMLPEDNRRQKLLFAPDNYESFELNVRAGFHYQYMRNMLQINNGNGTFSEIGQLAGLSNTDWSWAPLFADYDNDGWKDLYVTNGFLRDFTNMDFIKFMGDFVQQKGGSMVREHVLELVHKMPSSNVTNYLFKNNGDLTFTNVGARWGMNLPSNSNGAAYADLDQDGDLDLVVNNINQPAFVFRNESNRQLEHHHLKVKLEGNGRNTAGLGAKVTLFCGGERQYQEQMPARGYQSSVSPVLHFGLGSAQKIDSLEVVWPNRRRQVLRDIQADQLVTLGEKEAKAPVRAAKPLPLAFKEVPAPLAFTHAKSTINDFKRQPLLVNPLSFAGPCLVKGDVNGDGLEDVFAGGGNGQAGSLYVQQKKGQFALKPQPAFEKDTGSDHTGAAFLDADGDGSQDLYVCHGGYGKYLPEDTLLQDQLYLNDGKGNFTRSPDALPVMRSSKSCVKAADVNGDGFLDLFVGGRVIPGRYPETPQSYLLINDGKGHFKDQITTLAPALQRVGMVTDAAWTDLNGDTQPDLVLVGEWMPVTVMSNKGGKLTDQTNKYFPKAYRGWWNKLLVEDMNGDGKADLVVGNQGLNTQCKASDREPAQLFYKDFDENGSVDPILCFYIQGKSYPYVTRDELLDQISLMRTRFQDYKSYADATLKEIFTPEEWQGTKRLDANFLKTAYFQQDVNGKFQEKPLPLEAQFSPVFTITPMDYNQDGNKDLLLCGNSNQARLRFGKYDANYGLLLKGDGQGGFTAIPQKESGFRLSGDIRSVLSVRNTLLFGINQQPVKAYQTSTPLVIQ